MGIELKHVGGVGENSVREIGKPGGRKNCCASVVRKQEGTGIHRDIELTAAIEKNPVAGCQRPEHVCVDGKEICVESNRVGSKSELADAGTGAVYSESERIS